MMFDKYHDTLIIEEDEKPKKNGKIKNRLLELLLALCVIAFVTLIMVAP